MNKSNILKIVFKYRGVKRITELKKFKDGLVEQEKLVKAQIKSLDKIIKHELRQL